jgi:GntR family transcriptional regulator
LITIDKDSPLPVQHQLADRLRYLIVSGQFKVGDMLPSTRELGRSAGVSFHTVRSAYQALEAEDLVESVRGEGFRVLERKPVSKARRMEDGASLIHGALQRLVGMGLDESEIEYLLQEQLSILTPSEPPLSVSFLASFRELADTGAGQLSQYLAARVEPLVLADLEHPREVDVVVCPHELIPRALEVYPGADVHGVSVHANDPALEAAARLLSHQTLALIVQSPDSVQPVIDAIRTRAALAGQVVAASLASSPRQIRTVVDQADLVLFTEPTRRRVWSMIRDHERREPISFEIDRSSLERLREVV